MTDTDDRIEFVATGSSAAESSVEKTEVIAPKPSIAGSIAAVVGIIVVGWLVVASGDTDPVPTPATDSSTPTTTVSDPVPTRIEGDLADGNRFAVSEVGPSVVCATITDGPGSPEARQSLPVCHVRESRNGTPGVVADRLVFGFLPPDVDGVVLRYRERPAGNRGLRIDRDAGLFALPIRGEDAYRLQYLVDGVGVIAEQPLVPYPSGPSQSPADARRDGTPPALAELDFGQRLQPVAEWSALQEGPLVWSRTEVDGNDWGELLRLDLTGTQIRWSLPLPGVDLEAQLIRPDAIWLLGRQITFGNDIAVDRSEVRFPVVLIRIDRDTDVARVVLFEQPAQGGEPIEAPIRAFDRWEIGPPLPPIRLDSLVLDTSGLGLDLAEPDDDERRVFLDPTTLERLS